MNLVAAVLAFLCKEQRDTLVLHAEQHASLQTALDLDYETYVYAQRSEASEHGDTAPALKGLLPAFFASMLG